ncbi:MAG: hypothetical protein HC765_13055 [Brachymonas sp.]|nr:hypothetical protein [Brachymonas sp.]
MFIQTRRNFMNSKPVDLGNRHRAASAYLRLNQPSKSSTRIVTIAVLSAISMSAFAQGRDTEVRPNRDNLDARVNIDKVFTTQGDVPKDFNPRFSFDVKVTEEKLPPAPPGCKWETPKYEPANGQVNVNSGTAGKVTVINHLVCPAVDQACKDAKSLNVNLKGASQWLIAGQPPVPVSPVPSIFFPNSSNIEWVQKSGSTANSSTYEGKIEFCLCPNSRAQATVADYRSDDVGKLSFNGVAPFINAGSQWQPPSSNTGPAEPVPELWTPTKVTAETVVQHLQS